jgi:hypothetical protein
MWLRWLPWRYVVRRIARARGFIDPIAVWSRLHQFAQPSEVAAPLELLRAGVVFHARGLMNTAVIQHNLDWVWPYWVERQFDPHDVAFIPRAFSITHVNLTHRNWTAVGWPDCERMPIVDPRGLLTPFWDGWSLDTWIVAGDERALIPSRLDQVAQRLDWAEPGHLAVETCSDHAGLRMRTRAEVVVVEDAPLCLQEVVGWSPGPAWLVVALRPYNPEGVSFVHQVNRRPGGGWLVDQQRSVEFSEPPERHRLSEYRDGDVFGHLSADRSEDSRACDVGLCTAAAMFAIEPGIPRRITVRVRLADDTTTAERESRAGHFPGWTPLLAKACELCVPDERIQFLFDAAVRTVVLHTPGDVFPGPYTYKRFWFRDAAFILNALLSLGLFDRARRAIDRFPARQTRAGYFLSQDGEWDANGEALWIMDRYCQLSGQAPPPAWEHSIRKGARWIERKRLPDDLDRPHAGLLPAGFSAEHLGPNDFYYWDDFWSVAGLRAAARMLAAYGDADAARAQKLVADRLLAAIDRSLNATAERRHQVGIPASPYRRLDAGAIGSLAAGYPLQLWTPRDERLLATVEFLLRQCFVRGGFFQDMIHSGINPYLTLHVAQFLLRAGDARAGELLRTVGDLATSTGQWPEAIHPRTGGGCMGDGQHVWAAAEWILMLRNCFVREEHSPHDVLILGSGIPPEWLRPNSPALRLGPTPTPWGLVTITIEAGVEFANVQWTAAWRREPPVVDVRVPGFEPARPDPRAGQTAVRRLCAEDATNSAAVDALETGAARA